jgi:chromosome segregation ATPase
MHEKDVATIEIEIEPPSGSSTGKFDLEKCMGIQPPHIFKRVIDRNMGAESGRGIGASKYYINDRPSNIKAVKDLVQNVYQIQIDNLCTFLPQDKVGNFSGFNAQALLIETEKALLLHHYETHMKLIELEDDLRRDGTAKETIEDQLTRLEKENEAIEREKELMEQRMEAQALEKKLKQKLAWVKFDNNRIHALELKQLKDDCKKQLLLSRERLAPFEEKIENFRKDAGRMHSVVTSMDREIDGNKKNYAKHLQKADTFHDDIEDIIASINGMDSEQKNAERKVQAQVAKVEENKGILAQFPPLVSAHCL